MKKLSSRPPTYMAPKLKNLFLAVVTAGLLFAVFKKKNTFYGTDFDQIQSFVDEEYNGLVSKEKYASKLLTAQAIYEWYPQVEEIISQYPKLEAYLHKYDTYDFDASDLIKLASIECWLNYKNKAWTHLYHAEWDYVTGKGRISHPNGDWIPNFTGTYNVLDAIVFPPLDISMTDVFKEFGNNHAGFESLCVKTYLARLHQELWNVEDVELLPLAWNMWAPHLKNLMKTYDLSTLDQISHKLKSLLSRHIKSRWLPGDITLLREYILHKEQMSEKDQDIWSKLVYALTEVDDNKLYLSTWKGKGVRKKNLYEVYRHVLKMQEYW